MRTLQLVYSWSRRFHYPKTAEFLSLFSACLPAYSICLLLGGIKAAFRLGIFCLSGADFQCAGSVQDLFSLRESDLGNQLADVVTVLYGLMFTAAVTLIVFPLTILWWNRLTLDERRLAELLNTLGKLGAPFHTRFLVCALSMLVYAGLGWLGGVTLYFASVPLLGKLKLLGMPLGGFNLIPPISTVIIIFLVLAIVPLLKALTLTRKYTGIPRYLRSRSRVSELSGATIGLIFIGACLVSIPGLSFILPLTPLLLAVVIFLFCLLFAWIFGIFLPANALYLAVWPLSRTRHLSLLLAVRNIRLHPQRYWVSITPVLSLVLSYLLTFMFLTIFPYLWKGSGDPTLPGSSESAGAWQSLLSSEGEFFSLLQTDIRSGWLITAGLVAALTCLCVAVSTTADNEQSRTQKALLLQLGCPPRTIRRAKWWEIILPYIFGFSQLILGVILFLTLLVANGGLGVSEELPTTLKITAPMAAMLAVSVLVQVGTFMALNRSGSVAQSPMSGRASYKKKSLPK
ncbi:MAG: hypothetical protein ACLVCI_01335 [Varibaculum timonense]